MTQPCIILITGFPGTGKTRLGHELSARFHMPFITKDALKERIFDTLGTKDQAWSRQVSGAAHRIIDYMVNEELTAGHGIILESNFKADVDSARFRAFQQQYHCPCVQVLCWAQGDVLFERFIARQRSSERHAGHVLDISDEQVRADLAPGKCETLNINGPTIEVDTTDFSTVDYAAIATQVETALGNQKS